MQLRKERIHYHGKTNKDKKLQQRIDESNTTQERSRIKSLTIPQNNHLSRQTETIKFIDPILETQHFTQKKYPQHKIGYKRYAQLDESAVGKMSYNGDSKIQYGDHRQENNLLETQKHLDKEKLVNQKIEGNAKVVQETQLVNLENKITNEGKVDLEKVRDIKRSIRRRYANRKNFQKIFNSWDEDANGAISVKNLYNMVKRMGININMDEAKVLLASADKDESNDLGMDEFMDLIFNDQDILNKDIQQLKQDKSATIKLLIKDAKLARQRKHHNKINVMLKNRLLQLGQWLHDADETGNEQLPYKKFEEIVKKLRIDERILSSEDIKILASNFLNENQLVDCPKFIQHLKQFQLKEEIYDDPYLAQIKNQEFKQNNNEEEKIHYFDITKINGWHLERMRYRANNMLNKLKKYIPDKERFLEQFQQLNEDQIKQINFQEAITNFLSSVNENVHKFDIESLVSVLQFNQYKSQSKNEILRIIYDENDDDFFERAQQQKKQPPPPHSGLVQAVQFESNSQQLDGYFKKKLGLSLTMPNINKYLMDVLQKVDDRVFNKQQKQLQTFKDFDIDRDGYVSQNDIKQRMKHVLNQEELNILVDYLDPQNKGFANFTEFSQKIRSGMTILDENGKQVINVNTQPSKTTLIAATSFLPELNSCIESFKKPFQPSKNRSDYKPSTRYQNTPAKDDTFKHFIPLESSGLWASAESRFSKNREGFLQEEKIMKAYRQEQKYERIRSYQEEIRTRIKSQDDRQKYQ